MAFAPAFAVAVFVFESFEDSFGCVWTFFGDDLVYEINGQTVVGEFDGFVVDWVFAMFTHFATIFFDDFVGVIFAFDAPEGEFFGADE